MAIEETDTVKQWGDNHTDWYEKSVLWFATFDTKLFGILEKTVCRSAAGMDSQDFATPIYNSYFKLVRNWRLTFPKDPVTLDTARIIAAGAEVGILRPSEVPTFLAVYEELSRKTLEAARGVVSQGLGYWIARRRTTSAVLRPSRRWDASSLPVDLYSEASFIDPDTCPGRLTFEAAGVLNFLLGFAGAFEYRHVAHVIRSRGGLNLSAARRIIRQLIELGYLHIISVEGYPDLRFFKVSEYPILDIKTDGRVQTSCEPYPTHVLTEQEARKIESFNRHLP